MANLESANPEGHDDRPSCFICRKKTYSVHRNPYGHTCDPGTIDDRLSCFVAQTLFRRKHLMTAQDMQDDPLDVNSGIVKALLDMIPDTVCFYFRVAEILFDHLKRNPMSVPEAFSKEEASLQNLIRYYTSPGDDEHSLSFSLDRIEACNPPQIAEGHSESAREEAYKRRIKLMCHVVETFELDQGRFAGQNSCSTDVFCMPRLLPEDSAGAWGDYDAHYRDIFEGVLYDYAVITLCKIRAANALKNIENLALVLLRTKLPVLLNEVVLEMQGYFYVPCMRNNVDFKQLLRGCGDIRPWIATLERDIQAIFDLLSRHHRLFWNLIFGKEPSKRQRERAVAHSTPLGSWLQALDVYVWVRGSLNIRRAGTDFCYAHDDCEYYPEVMIWMRNSVNV